MNIRKANVRDVSRIAEILVFVKRMNYRSIFHDDDRIGYKMAQILGVPDEYELVCFLPIGIAETKPAIPKKKPFCERAYFNSFPKTK